jgi:hypothetical protein
MCVSLSVCYSLIERAHMTSKRSTSHHSSHAGELILLSQTRVSSSSCSSMIMMATTVSQRLHFRNLQRQYNILYVRAHVTQLHCFHVRAHCLLSGDAYCCVLHPNNTAQNISHITTITQRQCSAHNMPRSNSQYTCRAVH